MCLDFRYSTTLLSDHFFDGDLISRPQVPGIVGSLLQSCLLRGAHIEYSPRGRLARLRSLSVGLGLTFTGVTTENLNTFFGSLLEMVCSHLLCWGRTSEELFWITLK